MLRTIIISLHVIMMIGFMADWTFELYVFIECGYNAYSVFMAFADFISQWRVSYLIHGVTVGIGTILVNITIVC